MQKNDQMQPEEIAGLPTDTPLEKLKFAGLSWQLPLLGVISAIGMKMIFNFSGASPALVFLCFMRGSFMTIRDLLNIKHYKNCLLHAIIGLIINLSFIALIIFILIIFATADFD